MNLHVRILGDEEEALRELAARKRQPLCQQAALFIRESLKRHGMLAGTAVFAKPQIVD